MAMNKAERERLQKAEQELAEAMALHWPIEPKPEPMDMRALAEETRKETGAWNVLITGWSSHAQHSFWGSFRVQQGCSNGTNHDSSRTDKTSTQGPGVFYATEREALLAARWSLCREYAKSLAALDKRLISTSSQPSLAPSAQGN